MATHSNILAWRIPMNSGAWWTIVYGVAKSQTQLSDQEHIHRGSQRVGHNWVTELNWLLQRRDHYTDIKTPLELLGREGNGTPLQYSCLENPMDGGAWWAAVRGVAKSRTRLSDFAFTFHFHALEKEIATHSSVLAWRIPGTGEPHGLPSMGSHRVRHEWSDLAAAAELLGRESAGYENTVLDCVDICCCCC